MHDKAFGICDLLRQRIADHYTSSAHHTPISNTQSTITIRPCGLPQHRNTNIVHHDHPTKAYPTPRPLSAQSKRYRRTLVHVTQYAQQTAHRDCLRAGKKGDDDLVDDGVRSGRARSISSDMAVRAKYLPLPARTIMRRRRPHGPTRSHAEYTNATQGKKSPLNVLYIDK